MPDNPITLVSASLLLNLLAARAVGGLPPKSTLSDAYEWATGNWASRQAIQEFIPLPTQSQIIDPLRTLQYHGAFIDILPYALEVFETEDELLLRKGPSRLTKRDRGIFYTPSDLADYMANAACSLADSSSTPLQERTWIDPACGTGCMLAAAIYCIASRLQLHSGSELLAISARSLFGIDTSLTALQSAAYVTSISAAGQELGKSVTLLAAIQMIRPNLALADATSIQTREQLQSILPALKNGASIMISNPPYSSSSASYHNGGQLRFPSQPSVANTPSGSSTYLEFLRMLPTLTAPDSSAGAMVVPLAIAYSSHSELKATREFMGSAAAEWRFAHFDRTPDSLFGDDVKTRNTIVLYSRAPSPPASWHSTRLIRWSSRSRNALFESLAFCQVSSPLPADRLPKIGDPLENQILARLEAHGLQTVRDALTPSAFAAQNAAHLMRHTRTAYNWLPIELLEPHPHPPSTSEAKYRYLLAPNRPHLLATFALLNSTTAYWLWRVWEDGFHLNDNFLLSLPFSPANFDSSDQDILSRAGQDLWSEMLLHPVITSNAGKRSETFCPFYGSQHVRIVDELIVRRYNLPPELPAFLDAYLEATVLAGRQAEMDTNPALANWKQSRGAI